MIEANKGDTLSIFVENMGRVGCGSGILRGTKVCLSFLFSMSIKVMHYFIFLIYFRVVSPMNMWRQLLFVADLLLFLVAVANLGISNFC